jgi:hypothetical protein
MVLDILLAARAKLADERHWTQGQSARDPDGNYVNPCAYNAVAHCASGAVYSVCDVAFQHHMDRALSGDAYSTVSFEEFQQAIGVLASFIWDDSPHPIDPVSKVVLFNDMRTHDEVLALFDAAIAKLRARDSQVTAIMDAALSTKAETVTDNPRIDCHAACL